ncbi:hypothetical protein SUGI_0125230 [Cryptomeria japonica]|uniref:uncharacterized protein LOC131054032 n=1 Tax=Cryptomeria japonica TaxID=3369 RepID=UPI002408E704|nr:uncharacterized protein LOC131054032 [Cryptomeria japonica]GLJ10276.1 hypothetical protein SUGI_0125230 [Cryptomeria japonica]
MLEGRGVIESTDMAEELQRHAMLCASEALDLFDVSQCQNIACHIKKEFDKFYGGGWQCIVGMNFGCYFTHGKGSFIYFCLGTLKFLIFKGA